MSQKRYEEPQTDGEGRQTFCPLVAFTSPNTFRPRICGREKCGFWCNILEQCSITSITYILEAILKTLDKILLEMPKDR